MVGKITVVGSSNMDMIVQVDHLPRPGETVLGGEYSQAAGGKGANQAVAAARAGGDVTFITAVGDDAFGDQFIQGFRGDGIDTKHVKRIENTPSGVALINVDSTGENSIAVAPGANARLTPDHIQQAEATIAESDILLLQLEIPMETVTAAIDSAAESDVKVILNPAPAQQLSVDILNRVTYLTPNESESEILTDTGYSEHSGYEKIIQRILETGVRYVVLTLGADGAILASGKKQTRFPAYPVTPVDTTAAGDVFNGALAVALAQEASLERAIRFASAAGALSAMKLGAQPSAPNRQEILEFLSSQGEG